MPTVDGVLPFSDHPRSQMAKHLILLVSLCLAGFTPAQNDSRADRTTVDYVVRATTVEADERGQIPVEVRVRWSDPESDTAVLQVPHWTPGSYRLRDFPQRVEPIRASVGTDGEPSEERPIETFAPGRFGVRYGDCDWVEVTYLVRLAESDRFMHPGPGRTALTYEGPQLYVYVEGLQQRRCSVRFELPDGWDVGSGLHPTGGAGFWADDYDFLVDCPVKLGTFRRWQFETDGKPIDVVLDGADKLEFDDAGWIANIRAVTETQAAMFGGLPLDHYTFLFTGSRTGKGGGLEHLTSTAIGVQTGSLLRGSTAKLSTIAHEFFHLWNVKRARPIELGPFDYTRPNRTTMLWLCEGITSYYTDVTLARMGLMDESGFWRSMAQEIRSFEGNPARSEMSSADASYTVWDPSPAFGSISYYNSGQVLGLLLDVSIRGATDNRRSLDDVMVALVELCDEEGRGYTEAEFEGLVEKLSGTDHRWFFESFVRGRQVPDYDALLAAAGVSVVTEESSVSVLDGLRTLVGEAGRLPFWSPPEDSRASHLRSGVLLAVDGQLVADTDEVRDHTAGLDPTEPIELTLRRADGVELQVRTTLRREQRRSITLTLDDEPDDLAQRIRAGILSVPEGR